MANLTTPDKPVEKTDKFMVSTGFSEADADERGWIVFRETRHDGVYTHVVPVAEWPKYEKEHGF